MGMSGDASASVAAEPASVLADVLRPGPRDETDGFRFRNSAGQERYFSFADFRVEVLRRARRLSHLGLRPGDRVALVLFDEADMALGFLGVSCAGLVPVLIAPRNATRGGGASDSLIHIINNSGARLLLTSAELAGVLAPSLRDHPAVEIAAVERIFADGADGDDAGFAPPVVSPDAVCFLQYTSGSTGRPKGTVITHRNLLTNARACIAATRAEDDEQPYAVSWLPLYHDFGLIGFFLAPLIARYPATILSPNLFARRPRAWLDALHECRATITGAPNFAFGFLLRRFKGIDVSSYDLRKLRVLFCGGEPIQRGALLEFAERLAPSGFDARCFLPCYGLAESTLAVTFHPTWHPLVSDTVCAETLGRGAVAAPSESSRARVLVSCGRPLSDHQVEIVAPDHAPLGECQIGEIRAKGPSVSNGYFADPETTSNAWRDGWLYTGDLGYFRDGHLYVCGRKKDLIIVRGANYYPQDIEWTAERLSELRGRSVVAVPVDVDGAESFAVIAEAPIGDQERRAALCAEIAEAITRDHGIVPADVRIVPLGTLPLTSSGKVQRRRTRELYQSGAMPQRAGVRAYPEPA